MKFHVSPRFICLSLAFCLSAGLSSTSSLAADARLASAYVHEDYGYNLQFPRPLVLCTTPAPAPNHGFVALLHSSSCTDNAWLGQPHIELYVRYDVSDMADNSAGLGMEICEGKAAHPARLAGVKTALYQCATKSHAGLLHEAYFFVHKREKETGIILGLDLYSDRQRIAADRAVLKQMLKTLRWE